MTQQANSALVTGATGYIGANLARRLAAEGWEVHLLVRPSSDRALLAPFQDRVTLHTHDGTIEQMHSIMKAAAPSVVFHLASLFIVQHTAADIAPLIAGNILFGTQLLEAMASCGCSRIVNTGTSWQHYKSEGFNPVNLYAATKEAFAALLRFYREERGVSVVTLKLFDTYGPGDPRPKLLSLLDRVAAEGTTLAMSPGEQLLDMVYIDDAVDAFMVAAERLLRADAPLDESFAVGSGKPVRLRDLVILYSRMTGRKPRIEWGGRPYRHREVMVPWHTGETLPGWRPKVSLEEGFRRMEEWRRKQAGNGGES